MFFLGDRYYQSGRVNCALDSSITTTTSRTGTGNVTWDCARLEFHFRRSVALYVEVLLLPLLILTMPLLVLLLVSPNSRLKIPSMLILVVLYSVLLHLSCAIVPIKSSQVSIIGTQTSFRLRVNRGLPKRKGGLEFGASDLTLL